MGIGIGWPNASASNQSQMVYYTIQGACGGIVRPGATTQLVDSSIYQTGDYVDYNDGAGRIQLGDATLEIGDPILNISGSVYTGCP